MSHRALITFPDQQYEQLRELSGKTGAPVSELVRRAVTETYKRGTSDYETRLKLLAAGSGAWKSYPDDLDSVDIVNEVRRSWPTPQAWRKHD